MKLENDKKGSGYSVKATCKRLGIGPHTLRAWENRYGAVEPTRTQKGQRLYSDEDVNRLANIVHLVNLGHSVGVIARLSDKELIKILKQPLKVNNHKSSPECSLSPLFGVFEEELKRFDVHAISSLLDQKRTSLGARAFVLEILGPLMRWIGTRIDEKNLSIAHEHALSAVVRDQIYQTLRYGAAPIHSKNCPRFVLATPEDDLHEFGILMSATLLSHYGIPSHLLGANLPADALALAVKGIRGKIVILGNAPVPEEERRVSFEDYLREIHKLLPKDVAVWIGGGGIVPHLRSVMPGREHRFLGSLHELDTLIARFAPEVGKGVL